MVRFVSTILLLLLLSGCQLATQKLGLLLAPQATSPIDTVSPGSNRTDPVAPTTSTDIPVVKVELPAVESLPPYLVDYLHIAPRLLPYSGDFPLSTHPRVEKLVKRYSGSSKNAFGRWLERAGRFIPKIQLVFADEGIPLDLAYLAMIESGFNVRAYSWAHAAGPWQFIEATGKLYGLENDWWQDGRLNLERSTRAAAKHLKYLHHRFDGDWYLAVAAYNAGGGKVRKAVRKGGSRNFWDLTEGQVLQDETKNYLPKLLASLTIVKDLEAYGFATLKFQKPLTYEKVTIATTTDLDKIARYSGISYKELKELNPELKRWCTPPKAINYQLNVPFGSARQVRAQYAKLPVNERASYHRHKIKSGDTLQVLGRKYRIRVDDIVALNNIKNPRALQIGHNLILPLQQGFTALPANVQGESYVKSRRRTYKVRSGDSLWSISRRFDVTQKQLRVWNKLGWSNLLRPGQVLAVSKRGVRVVAKATPKAGLSRQLIYKVVPGDTLWDIGRQFDVATEQIRRWNKLSLNHVLQPGQKLTLKVSAS